MFVFMMEALLTLSISSSAVFTLEHVAAVGSPCAATGWNSFPL